MRVVYVSDFDIRGSGYSNIGQALCDGLVERGHKVTALGLHYRGNEHDHRYAIVPAEFGDLVQMVTQLGYHRQLDVLVVALDIPLQDRLLSELNVPQSQLPYVGVFPVEAGPICQTWAISLLRMSRRLVMSEFGQGELAAVGVGSDFIPIGIDHEAWRPPKPKERDMLREGLGLGDNDFAVLTVADNQERKNLSGAIELLAKAMGGAEKQIHWLLVTRPDSQVGWRLDDLAGEYGVFPFMHTWNRGISFKSLWSLYAAADCFLLTSKAEGLAMPILEAMSVGLPVLATDATAMREHLKDGRGLLIPYEFQTRDPWGNSWRFYVDTDEGARMLQGAMDVGTLPVMVDVAHAYARERDWERAVDALEDAVDEVGEEWPRRGDDGQQAA